MSAIYFDKHGWARWVEDERTGPQPAHLVAGMERHPIDTPHIQPCDIVAATRDRKEAQ